MVTLRWLKMQGDHQQSVQAPLSHPSISFPNSTMKLTPFLYKTQTT
uniref:Uncharacterized protein n=1 Tax=Rhizophora mucronata TaxID=61149 RepID=A0A2P2NQ03_RHIMU